MNRATAMPKTPRKQNRRLSHNNYAQLIDFLRMHKDAMHAYKSAQDAADAISRSVGFPISPLGLKEACEYADVYYPARTNKKNGHAEDSELARVTAEVLLAYLDNVPGPDHSPLVAKLRALVADAKVIEGFGKVTT